MTVRTRFAPSPTGYLHIGGVRTALFCWLFAKRHKGTFVLRIEDTDRERSTPESIDAILEGLKWMELTPDEGPFYQTDRMDRYGEAIKELLDKGMAYHCYCSKDELEQEREAQRSRGEKPRYSRKCRHNAQIKPDVEPVVRFKNPIDGAVIWDDAVKGRIVIGNSELDDLIICRPDGTPTYNFCVVVDDLDMEITHVVRGDDHVNNTPRQINILRALGGECPVYAHVPMILGADGQRLSKRHGAVSVLEYRNLGILPQAMRNYLVRLGWSHGDQEIFSYEELCSLFSLDGVNRAPAAFDPEKLMWLNQQYIMQADARFLGELLGEQLVLRGVNLADGPPTEKVADVLRERARNIVDMADKSEYFYRDFDEYDENAAKKNLRPVASQLLTDARQQLSELSEWSCEKINSVIESILLQHDVKLGKLAQPIRVAISGTAATPAIDVTLELIGKERVVQRLDHAIKFILDRVAKST